MKRTVSAALAAMCCLVFLTGCGTMKTTWRDTRKLYREYINTDPTIDLSDEGIGDKGLQRLAALFMPADAHLLGLLHALGSQDMPPENDWCQQLLTNNDWLSGVAVVDTSGTVLFQAPSVALRPMDYSGLQEFADRYKVRKMGAQVKTDEFGTVVMVAEPYFKNNEWAGLIVAYFDPRNLLRFSPEPDALTVVSTAGLVWAGGGGQGEALAALKWDDILKGSVQGELSVAGGQYAWQARYLGQLELIYMTDVREARARKPEPAQKAEPDNKAAEPASKVPSSTAPQTGAPANP